MAGFIPMEEDTLTYDALRRVERQENTSPRLTRLEPRFWQRLGEHLNRLREAFQAQQEEDPTARRTVVLADELRNTQRLAESIWALREKKVVQAAMGAVRRREGNASVPDHATQEERALFTTVMGVLVGARDEAAITDPFAQKRRDRVAAEAAKEAESKSKQGDGGGADERSERRVDPLHAHAAGPAGVAPSGHPAAGEAPASSATGAPGQGEPGRIGGREESPGGSRARAGEGAAVVREDERRRADAGPAGEAGEKGGREAGEEAQAVEGGGGVGAPGEQEMELRVVQALKPVPLFAGPDLVTYELESGEVGTLPSKAAQILEQRGLVRILAQE